MSEGVKNKKVDWGIFLKRCPSCKSSDIEKQNIYRRKWILKNNGIWELKEQQKNICKACGEIWWN